ncbi:radical SAM family heme chaperone HemW [Petrachloros mirabilis]
MTVPIGLYIHVPFCRERCDFCAFYLELYREPAAESFLRALMTELRLHAAEKDFTGRTFQSVYFGGGTPTALRTGHLLRILDEAGQSFLLSTDCEITVEAHPGTVTPADLAALFAAGVNRISFGAESMNDKELLRIGRPGGAAETIEGVRWAREAGFTNINLDLMYGLPGQTLKDWHDTLTRCIALGPSHLSCYALTVEEGTRYAHDIRADRNTAPDESVQVEMFHRTGSVLTEAGYEQYEISNYAKPGFVCRHNLLYWTNGDYLGVGPSAQSFVQGVRFGTIANLTAYQQELAQGRIPIRERTPLSKEEHLRDAVIFGLRLSRGVPTAWIHQHAVNFGHLETLEKLRSGRFIEEEGAATRLSAQGRLHADTIAERLY